MGIIVHYAKSTVIVFPVGLQFTRPSNTVLFVFGSFEGEAISIDQVFAIACYVHHLLDIVWHGVHVAATTISRISAVATLDHFGSRQVNYTQSQFSYKQKKEFMRSPQRLQCRLYSSVHACTRRLSCHIASLLYELLIKSCCVLDRCIGTTTCNSDVRSSPLGAWVDCI